jgi:hypothetical protein
MSPLSSLSLPLAPHQPTELWAQRHWRGSGSGRCSGRRGGGLSGVHGGRWSSEPQEEELGVASGEAPSGGGAPGDGVELKTATRKLRAVTTTYGEGSPSGGKEVEARAGKLWSATTSRGERAPGGGDRRGGRGAWLQSSRRWATTCGEHAPVGDREVQCAMAKLRRRPRPATREPQVTAAARSRRWGRSQ